MSGTTPSFDAPTYDCLAGKPACTSSAMKKPPAAAVRGALAMVGRDGGQSLAGKGGAEQNPQNRYRGFEQLGGAFYLIGVGRRGSSPARSHKGPLTAPRYARSVPASRR